MAHSSYSGGTVNDLLIVDFSRNGNAYSLSVKTDKNAVISFAPECASIKIEGTYDWLFWLFKRNSLVQEKRHSKSLEYIEKHFRKGKPVRFGVIGEGLKIKHHPDGSCHAESRALTLIEEETTQVYSFYKWP